MVWEAQKMEEGMSSSKFTLTRRSALRIGAGGAVATLSAPVYIRGALASSGELNALIWSDELPKKVIDAFTAATGIKVNTTPFVNNEEQANKLKLSFGEGYDICMPSLPRPNDYRDLEVLAPFDTNKLNLDAYLPLMRARAKDMWTWEKDLYFVPHVWGSEGLSWRTDKLDLNYASASYGLAWNPDYQGKVLLRPLSGLVTLGLWLDATGKLPTNRMLDTYKNEETGRKIFSELLAYAVAHKAQVKRFSATADDVRLGFLNEGCVVGVTWDGPAQAMRKDNKPVRYIAPQEGAISWCDGWALVKAAKNVEQAYALLNFVAKPEIGAMIAAESGYNSVILGSEKFASEQDRKIFMETYPGDALEKLWPYPAVPSWYIGMQNEYAEKFKAA
jgi:spermidine/putrescine transport system substrate-binding protein